MASFTTRLRLYTCTSHLIDQLYIETSMSHSNTTQCNSHVHYTYSLSLTAAAQTHAHVTEPNMEVFLQSVLKRAKVTSNYLHAR